MHRRKKEIMYGNLDVYTTRILIKEYFRRKFFGYIIADYQLNRYGIFILETSGAVFKVPNILLNRFFIRLMRNSEINYCYFEFVHKGNIFSVNNVRDMEQIYRFDKMGVCVFENQVVHTDTFLIGYERFGNM